MEDSFLFRGKPLFYGDFIYGNHFYHPGKNKSYIQPIDNDDEFDLNHNLEVESESVGQCTGLKDKNGNLIYKGDILTFDNSGHNGDYVHKGNPCFVLYRQGNFIATRLSDDLSTNYWIGSPCMSNIEIIGNKTENPELLERDWKNEVLRG